MPNKTPRAFYNVRSPMLITVQLRKDCAEALLANTQKSLRFFQKKRGLAENEFVYETTDKIAKHLAEASTAIHNGIREAYKSHSQLPEQDSETDFLSGNGVYVPD